MFFGINQICLTDLLNSQINDIYSSQPSEKGWQRHVSRAPRDEKNKRNPRGKEKKKSSIKYRTYECMKWGWNVKCAKTQNSHLSKHACIIIVCGCTEILQLNTQHTCCKKKEFENETYMNLGTPRKAYEFQCFFVRECRLFSCNLEYHEALLAKNRSL